MHIFKVTVYYDAGFYSTYTAQAHNDIEARKKAIALHNKTAPSGKTLYCEVERIATLD